MICAYSFEHSQVQIDNFEIINRAAAIVSFNLDLQVYLFFLRLLA